MNSHIDIFEKRLQVVEDAVRLKEPEWLPVVPMVSALPYYLYGGSYRDSMYDYPRATESILQYFEEFQPDAVGFSSSQFTSGKANEIAQTSVIDWPGRPGTKLSDESSHQFIDREYMSRDEYDELIHDYMGFILKKYIPRVFPALAGLSGMNFVPFCVMNTKPLGMLHTPKIGETHRLFEEITAHDAEAVAATKALNQKLYSMGFPPMYNTGGQAPFDIVGDYFRGTLGMLMDQMECPEKILEACSMFADMLIEYYKQFDFSLLPVKRVLFPLHKGMDGFMSPGQYETLYWTPLKKVLTALIDMGITPFVYTEGEYNLRLEQLADIPKGKVIYHFENVDMEKAKKILGNVACISGNLSITLLQTGTREQVSDHIKWLIDTCAPGGGYIFDTNAFIDNAKRENIETMFEVCRSYGRKS